MVELAERKLKLRYIWYAIILLYLLIATFPCWYYPIQVGLDPSWAYAVNFLPHSDRLFGRDVVFTYGPLGYLLYPISIGHNLSYAVAFWLGVYVLFALLLWHYFLKSNRVLTVVGFSAFYIAAIGLGLYKDYQLLTIIILLSYLLILPYNEKAILPANILMGILSAILLFIKFSSGIGALSILIFAMAMRIIRNNQKFLRLDQVLAFCVYIVTVLLISAFCIPHNLLRWLRASLEITSGYSTAMSIVGPKAELVIGLIAASVYLILVLLLKRMKSNLFYASLIPIVALFLSFKHGFVRQDGHVIIFFTFLLATTSILLLAAGTAKEAKVALVASLLILSLTAPVVILRSDPSVEKAVKEALAKGNFTGFIRTRAPQALDFFFNPKRRVMGTICGRGGFFNIRALLYFRDLQTQLNRQSQLNLQRDKLSSRWLSKIKRGTVDVLPWEIAYCPANNLSWSPNPVLQTYSIYTPFLDQWSADHYAKENAPDFLIIEFVDIDGRHLMLDVPSSWRKILENYDLVDKEPEKGALLLQRKSILYKDVLRTLGYENSAVGEWVDIPSSDKIVFASIDMRLRPIGVIMKLLFRIPPVNIDLLYDSGRIASYRIIPETAKNGLLINYLPLNAEELAKLFTSAANDRVVKFRISGPGLPYYVINKISWWESSYTIRFTPDKRLDPQKLTFAGHATPFSIDSVNGRPPLVQGSPFIVSADRDNVITVNGWAVDGRANDKAAGIFINVDGQLDIPALYGLDRRDVAEYFKNGHYRFSGFTASFATSVLGKGEHTLSLKVVTADKNGYYVPEQEIILVIK